MGDPINNFSRGQILRTEVFTHITSESVIKLHAMKKNFSPYNFFSDDRKGPKLDWSLPKKRYTA